jgi:hypothetical protein
MAKRDASRQESADLYPHITVQLAPKWRVIECRDGEQWILKRKTNKWEGRSYCRTSAALERVVREHVGDIELPDWLKAPARFKNGARIDLEAPEALSPTPIAESRPAGLSGPPGGAVLEPELVAVPPSAVPIAPADDQPDPLAIPAFLRREPV